MRQVWWMPVVLIWLGACSAVGQEAAAPPPTLTLRPLSSATSPATEVPAASPTPTPAATSTPTPSATPPPSATPLRSGLVDALRSVNLRAGPGVSYASMAALQPGERVLLLAQDEDASWHKVQLADGREGWVAASLIAQEAAPGPGSDLPVIAVAEVQATATALVSAGDAPAAEPAAPAAEGPGEQTGNGTLRTGVDVLAYCDDPDFGFPAPTDIVAGSTIDVWWGWYARTEAQIAAHLANAMYNVTVDGEPLGDWKYYRVAPYQRGINTHIDWYVPYGPLDAGEHRIVFELTWREAISDGYNNFGPGTVTEQQTGSCTFRVLPAQP